MLVNQISSFFTGNTYIHIIYKCILDKFLNTYMHIHTKQEKLIIEKKKCFIYINCLKLIVNC